MVDFDPLGALSGPGAPDPDVTRFQLSLSMEFLIFHITCAKNMKNVNISVYV